MLTSFAFNDRSGPIGMDIIALTSGREAIASLELYAGRPDLARITTVWFVISVALDLAFSQHHADN
jgi:hypothetical protein